MSSCSDVLVSRAVFGAVLLVACLLAPARAHTYHLGGCPAVDATPNFDMDKFVGRWFVVQKTSTASRCLTTMFERGSGQNNWTVEQASEHPALGLVGVDNTYRYSGLLSLEDARQPARMTVRFPLSLAGSASYTVFMTDYDNYAAIFTCQKLAFAHRQSVSILSRTPTLDKLYLDKVRSRMSSYNIDPYALSIIDQNNCSGRGVDINIDPQTFSVANIAGVVRAAGSKIGDGVEYVGNGIKTLAGKAAETTTKRSADREELSEHAGDVAGDAEWFP